MSVERTSCVHRGNTFFGEYTILDGPIETVRVRYHGHELDGRTGGRLPEVIAHDLLRELVVLETVALKVAEAEKRAGMAFLGSSDNDTPEHRAAR